MLGSVPTTGASVAEIARGDDSRARARDWQPPKRFTAKGRDGETDIRGLIYALKSTDGGA